MPFHKMHVGSTSLVTFSRWLYQKTRLGPCTQPNGPLFDTSSSRLRPRISLLRAQTDPTLLRPLLCSSINYQLRSALTEMSSPGASASQMQSPVSSTPSAAEPTSADASATPTQIEGSMTDPTIERADPPTGRLSTPPRPTTVDAAAVPSYDRATTNTAGHPPHLPRIPPRVALRPDDDREALLQIYADRRRSRIILPIWVDPINGPAPNPFARLGWWIMDDPVYRLLCISGCIAIFCIVIWICVQLIQQHSVGCRFR